MNDIYKINLKIYNDYKKYLNKKINKNTGRKKEIFEKLLVSLEEKMLIQKKTKIHPSKFYMNLKMEFNNLKMIGENNG